MYKSAYTEVDIEIEFEDVLEFLSTERLTEEERKKVLAELGTPYNLPIRTVQDERFLEELANNWDYWLMKFTEDK